MLQLEKCHNHHAVLSVMAQSSLAVMLQRYVMTYGTSPPVVLTHGVIVPQLRLIQLAFVEGACRVDPDAKTARGLGNKIDR